VTAIDDHSRFCLAVGLVERATSRPVCGVFARILAEFGAPEAVLTDNGNVFTGRFASRPMEVLFDRICLGVRDPAPADRPAIADHDRQDRALPRHAAPGAADRCDVPVAGGRAAGDDGWIVEYTDRPHQALSRCTPAERFAARADDPGPALDLRHWRSGAAAMTGSVGGWPATA
jgi:hypothetical protein